MPKKQKEYILGNDNKTFCVMPWVSLNGSPNGDFRICCFESRLSHGHLGNVKDISIEKFWNSEKIRHIRKLLLKGEKVTHCSDCYHREKLGLKSMRISMNHHYHLYKYNICKDTDFHTGYTEFLPTYYDIRFSNICNLACRMCGSLFSTGRIPIDQELYSKFQMLTPLKSTSDSRFAHKLQSNNWELTSLSTDFLSALRTLYIAGGEPFLDSDREEFVSYLRKNGYSSQIFVIYNTNLTVINERDLLPLLDFEKVQFIVSCDGYKDIYEKIRIGAKWKIFIRNYFFLVDFFNKNQKSLDIVMNVVVQRDNIRNIYKLYIYVKIHLKISIDLIILTHPTYLAINNIPGEEKHWLKKLYTNIVKKYKHIIPEIEQEFQKIIHVLEVEPYIEKEDNKYSYATKVMDEYQLSLGVNK